MPKKMNEKYSAGKTWLGFTKALEKIKSRTGVAGMASVFCWKFV